MCREMVRSGGKRVWAERERPSRDTRGRESRPRGGRRQLARGETKCMRVSVCVLCARAARDQPRRVDTGRRAWRARATGCVLASCESDLNVLRRRGVRDFRLVEVLRDEPCEYRARGRDSRSMFHPVSKLDTAHRRHVGATRTGNSSRRWQHAHTIACATRQRLWRAPTRWASLPNM